jgi:hypothetical protein
MSAADAVVVNSSNPFIDRQGNVTLGVNSNQQSIYI